MKVTLFVDESTGLVTGGQQGDDPSQGVVFDLPRNPEPLTKQVVDGELFDADPAAIEAYRLPISKTKATNQVNAAAAGILNQVASPYGSQVAIYQAKYEEAIECKADVDPTDEKYPMLAQSRLVEGRSLSEEAGVIVAEGLAWRSYGAAVDSVRRTANKQIEAAPTVAGVESILANISWPGV